MGNGTGRAHITAADAAQGGEVFFVELLQNPPEKEEGQEQQPPPEDQKQPPRAYFLNIDTQWPGARVESEGNAARLVVPEKAEEGQK